MNSKKNLSLLLAGVSALSVMTAAHAQAGQAGPEGKAEEIIVTGSRVITNGENAPTPVTVMNVDQALNLQPTIVADALNQLPVFWGSQTQAAAPGGTSAASTTANVLNLRNFGTTRTLILYDGHRVAPTSIGSGVDANMIPQMLLQRVDVVTGGASAVYGSDAVTGVVNFIPDTTFTGIKFKAQAGVSTYGDAGSQGVGVALGTNFNNGRGHFEASYEFINDSGIASRTARQWGRDVLTVQNSPTGFTLVQNSRLNSFTFGGLIANGPFAGRTFSDAGTISALVRGSPIYGGVDSGGGGAYHDGSLRASLRSHQVFARLDYDLTDAVHAYVAGSANFNFNEQFQNYITLNKVAISATNPYLPSALQNVLAPANSTTFQLSKLLSDAPRFNPRISERHIYAIGGLKGTLGNNFRWDVSYSHSENTTNYETRNIVDNQKLFASLDSAVNPANGQIVCRVTLSNPTLYPGCVPLNPFGPTSDSAAAVDYFSKTGHVSYTFNMEDVAASITGTAFNNWAGPVNVAVSGEYRHLQYNIDTNVLPTDRVDCTGLTICSVTSRWSAGTSMLAPVVQAVWEAAAEVDFPLLADAPFAKSVNLNGAVRYTHYNTSGKAVTWKAGLDWHFSDAVAFRGTISRDIRAPNMTELFAAPTTILIPTLDTLTNTTTLVPNVFGGNPNLKPEVGLTYTAGVVFRPSFLPGFSLSIDGYRIRMKDALSSVTGSNQVFQKVCYDSRGTSPYCQLQVRPLNYTDTTSANIATKWLNSSVNIAEQLTYGADFEANYVGTLFNRPLSIRGLVSYQPVIRYSQVGIATVNLAGAAFSASNQPGSPKVRVFGSVHFSPVENFSIDVLERWRSSLKFGPDGTGLTFATGKIPSAAYTNLTLTWKVGKSEFFVNTVNLFNKQPPAAASFANSGQVGTAGGFVIGDDPVGRMFYTGVRVKF